MLQSQRNSIGTSDESEEESDVDYHWRTKDYWKLPENVRNAVDGAKMKRKHSDFYYRLNILNDKLHVYTSMFYNRLPKHQEQWQKKQITDL